MKLARLALGVALAVLLVAPATAFGWSREGHMVTGAIAYARLQAEDPEALAAVLALLRQHPQYEALLQPPADWGLDAEDADIAVFMNAARWADDVRSGPYEEYSEPWWHFVNYHYEDGELRPPGAPEDDGFLLWALATNQERMSQGSDRDRALALTWMFHLVGDVHQPMHSVAYHAPEHPDGDRGGNLFFIRVGPDEDTINMHWLWDDLVIGSGRFRDVRNRATELRDRPGLRPDELQSEVLDLNFEGWAAEGARLAAEHVYRNGTLRSGTREAGTVLPADYILTVKPLAERRAVLAGYRLARLLSAAF